MTLNAAATLGSDSALLSTIAGNAATLGGIIGGFTVARVVALAGEREGLERRLQLAQTDLAVAAERLDEATAEHLKGELSRAVWDSRDLIISTSGQANGHALLQPLDRHDYEASSGQLIDRLADAARSCSDCLALLSDRKETGGVRYKEWKDVRGLLAHVAPDEDPDLLEMIWREFEAREQEKDHEAERQAERQRKQAARSETRLVNIDPASFAGILRPALSLPAGLNLGGLHGISFPEPARHVAPDLRPGCARKVEDARATVAQLEASLAARSVPDDLRLGFWILVVFAALSIALPVVLMALDIKVTPFWRATVTAAFVAGVVALLGHIGLTLQTARGAHVWPLRRRRVGRPDRPQS